MAGIKCKVNLIFFASARDQLMLSLPEMPSWITSDWNGQNELRNVPLEVNWRCGATLRDYLCHQLCPRLAPFANITTIAINQKYIDVNCCDQDNVSPSSDTCDRGQPIMLQDGDEIAVIPPITGG